MNEETKRCPFCAEEILATAKKCKHCGSDLETEKGGKWIEELKAGLREGLNESVDKSKSGIRERAKAFVLFFRTFGRLRCMIGDAFLQQIYELALFLSILMGILNVFTGNWNLVALFFILLPIGLKIVFERMVITYLIQRDLAAIRDMLANKSTPQQ